MTAATIIRTPQLHTALDLKRILDADDAYRGIACEVEVDVWAPEKMRGSPRVTIELGDFAIGEPKGHYQPGAWWPVNPTSAFLPATATATLDPASTITSVLSGTPDAGGNFVVLFNATGITGTSGNTYQVSVDGGASYGFPIDLGTDTAITVHGATVDLGTATVVTAGDLLSWTMRFATSDLARPMLDDEQAYILSIHHPAPSDAASANRAAAAQDATDQLMRATMAALRRQIAGPFRVTARGTWPKAIVGYPDFVYGSLCVVSLVVASPILDDAASAGQALQFEMDGTVDLGAGPVAVVTALET